MQTILRYSSYLIFTVLLISCGSAAKDKKGEVSDMKVKLEELKKEKTELDAEIRKLEEEITKADPTAVKEKLVGITVLDSGRFEHFIELQGKVDADNVAHVAPRGMGGVVKAIYVKAGSRVRKGQLVMKLDDAVARQGVEAARQQIGGIRAQLEQARSVYQRQQNLWKQNIGSEIQVINARTNVETLESQLRAAEANVRMAQEQVNLSNVYAGISGVVDEVNVRVGEFFSPQSAAMPGSGIRIVNNNNMSVKVDVPENYISRVKEGTPVEIVLPELNRKVDSRVAVAGKFIDPNTRSFNVEARLPFDNNIRANQIALVKIRDYATQDAITIPVNTLQNDEKGKFVMVAVSENGKLVARKRQVIVGELYGEKLEVKSGLRAGEKLVTEGFQNLYDGQVITTRIS